MSVTAEVDIANLALAKLGQDSIASLDDSTRDSTILNRLYSANRDWCLGAYDWVSVAQRVHLTRANMVAVSDISAASPAVVTCSGHLYITGDMVTIEDVAGMTEINDTLYVVNSYTSTTITLYTPKASAVDSSSYTAYSSGGYVYLSPGEEWDYVYDLPSTCARVLTVMDEEFNHDADNPYVWTREKTKLYCDVEYASIKYVNKNTDVTAYDEPLVELMASRLAWLAAPKITGSESVANEKFKEFQLATFDARRFNGKNRQARPAPPAQWTSVH